MPVDEYTFSREQILEINYELLSISPESNERNMGGTVRDIGMIDFLVDEINEITDPYQKAATALQKIATRHPFIQGNKRTAVAVASIILTIAGYDITASAEQLNSDVRRMIIDEYEREMVLLWLREHTAKIDD
ncbi:MAG: type II toxin-antitoxin system death-on-curing family toxin [Methanocorpusculum sp.]|nr:type II toxin-antitoxin system death-on-curing family toxin [Methanocorpusculum sp.]